MSVQNSKMLLGAMCSNLTAKGQDESWGIPEMITKLSVLNFKSLRKVEIELQPFTMFVGANGSGKSSILQALNLICQSFRSDGENESKVLFQGLSRSSDGPVELEIASGAVGYRLKAGKGDPNLERPNNRQWSGIGCAFTPDIATSPWKQWKPDSPSVKPPSRTVLLRLETSCLLQPSPGVNPRIMAANGAGLHSALASMALNDPDTWQQLQSELRQIIPIVRRLRHTPAAPNQPAALLFDTVGADSLRASQVSEGTLLVLGLLTALHSPDCPNLILLDDLDRGLHPKAQRELIALLRGLLERNTNLQLLGSTHSPYMLDCMEPAEVRMTYLDEGATICAPLTRHPKFEKWKDEMYPGELWSLFGEEWVGETAVSTQGAGVEQGGSA